ncbi:hypothetical protein [Burkholderia ubonensis]|uniref:hypothetical protein n=1 Tax=Burkholderia ubonensis TaxID=101571 RepID=UPI000B046418|nr:hypothetical protein [Burkholderia ubonensis]
MTSKLTFHIERDGKYNVLTYKDGGCRPATPEEIELWDALLAPTQQPSGEPSLKNPMVRFPAEEDIREWEEARKRQPSGEVTDEAITWDRVVSIGSKHGMRWTEEAGWSFASDDPLHEFANDVARFYAARAQGGEQK